MVLHNNAVKVSARMQEVSDSTTLTIGTLSHLEFACFKFKYCRPKDVKFEIKLWFKEFESLFMKPMGKTLEKVEECVELFKHLDSSNIINQYFTVYKLLPSVAEYNRIITAYYDKNKVCESIVKRLSKESRADETVDYVVKDCDVYKQMYVALKYFQISVEKALDQKHLFKGSIYTKHISKGLELFGRQISADDKNYYDPSTKVLGSVGLQSSFYISEINVAYNRNLKAVLGTLK